MGILILSETKRKLEDNREGLMKIRSEIISNISNFIKDEIPSLEEVRQQVEQYYADLSNDITTYTTNSGWGLGKYRSYVLFDKIFDGLINKFGDTSNWWNVITIDGIPPIPVTSLYMSNLVSEIIDKISPNTTLGELLLPHLNKYHKLIDGLNEHSLLLVRVRHQIEKIDGDIAIIDNILKYDTSPSLSLELTLGELSKLINLDLVYYTHYIYSYIFDA